MSSLGFEFSTDRAAVRWPGKATMQKVGSGRWVRVFNWLPAAGSVVGLRPSAFRATLHDWPSLPAKWVRVFNWLSPSAHWLLRPCVGFEFSTGAAKDAAERTPKEANRLLQQSIGRNCPPAAPRRTKPTRLPRFPRSETGPWHLRSSFGPRSLPGQGL